MNTASQNISAIHLPRELRAVLGIFNHDQELKAKALPHVNIERKSIDWPKIWANDFGGGHAAAILWAQAIWYDCVETRADPFDRAFAMDAGLQHAVIEALTIRWGIYQEDISEPSAKHLRNSPLPSLKIENPVCLAKNIKSKNEVHRRFDR